MRKFLVDLHMKIHGFMTYIYVACGGALGSILRVYLGSMLPMYTLDKFPLPIPILVVNILGCFCIGLCSELTDYNLRLFLISGILGGFTTFSAFSLEFALLWQKNMYYFAIVYCLASVLFSILAFFIGSKLIKLIYL